ncbi:hypothetical protein CLG85_013185 [Yangia mangrovi]|uniref:Uncharacterized protein n=1 Tax=Alloyangia mangrovi TaxID=1779329 RepID=A0A2A3JVM3_9RHOB|nr:hypothetical protein [Alloyangia mangrovi]MCA0938361.1 hypothetical protein [Alloyangia pacifica]MCA0943719.1 hypothetical protein [Alloyangia pacifica]MCT4371219.1 hypothetical protein [Alloyangia mangrovi]
MTLRSTTRLGLAVLTAASLSAAAHAQTSLAADPATQDQAPLESSEMTQSTGAAGSGMTDTAPVSPQTAEALRAEVPQSYGQAISSLRNADLSMADPETVVEASKVEILPLSTLKGQANESAEALDDALKAAAPELDALRGLLSDNDELTAELDQQGFAPDDVIGVYAAQDHIELLVDDRG